MNGALGDRGLDAEAEPMTEGRLACPSCGHELSLYHPPMASRGERSATWFAETYRSAIHSEADLHRMALELDQVLERPDRLAHRN